MKFINIYKSIMSLVKSQKIHLYVDEKATDRFEIVANENDAVFSYVGKVLKFNGNLQYKDTGVASGYSSVYT
jgi:hypothetical protein